MTIEIGSRMVVFVTVKNHKTNKTGEAVCWVECADLSPRYDTPLEMPDGSFEDVLMKGDSYWVENEAVAQKDNQDGSQPWQYRWAFVGIVDEPEVEDDPHHISEAPGFETVPVAPEDLLDPNGLLPWQTGYQPPNLDRFRERGVNRRKALEEANKRFSTQPPTVSTDQEITETAQTFFEFLEG